MLKNLRDSYKLYKEKVKEPIDMKTYLIVVGEYNKFLISKVSEGKEVSLPSRLGSLSIVGRKQVVKIGEDGAISGLAPDWVKTKALWDVNPAAKAAKQRVFHTNSHTDNVRYKYVWTKKRVLIENKTLYSLKMTRTNKRIVHQSILDGNQYITK
jgi:hypothetical protein